MCTQWLGSEACMNHECPHHLFWQELKLDMKKITITKKALKIRNCCCLINEPWTPEEIRDAWGLAREKVRQCEQSAWRKVRRGNGVPRSRVLSHRETS